MNSSRFVYDATGLMLAHNTNTARVGATDHTAGGTAIVEIYEMP